MAAGDRTLTVNGRCSFAGNYSYERAAGGRNTGAWDAALDELRLTTGTGTDMSDRIYFSGGTVSTSGTEWDLTSLTDEYGSISFAEVRGIILTNGTAAGGGNLIWGNASAAQFVGWMGAAAHTMILKPGEKVIRYGAADGAYPVANGSTDVIKLAASTGTVTYTMIIWGTSA